MTGTKRRLIDADHAVKDLGARLLAANQKLGYLQHELHELQDNHDTLLRVLIAVVREHQDRSVFDRVSSAVVKYRNLWVSESMLKADQKGWHLITTPIEDRNIVELAAEYAEPIERPPELPVVPAAPEKATTEKVVM